LRVKTSLDIVAQRASAAVTAHPWLAQGRKVMDVWADSGAIQPVGHDRKHHFPSSTYQPSALASH
jgi:hypothetical protein